MFHLTLEKSMFKNNNIYISNIISDPSYITPDGLKDMNDYCWVLGTPFLEDYLTIIKPVKTDDW